MKFTLWAPEFKDLPTVHLNLPPTLSKKGIQILYGYTQPSKPYDKTLFVQILTPVNTKKAELKKLATQLKSLVKKGWDKSKYKIIKIEDEFKGYQCFIYFQLKRTDTAMISSKSLATPLSVPKVQERARGKPRKAARKTTRRRPSKVSRRKSAKTTRRKPAKATRKKSTRKTTRRRR